MGWQESRVTLIPPGWYEVSEPSPTARTYGDRPVMIVRTERESNGQGVGLPPALVQHWLEERGFKISETWKNGAQLEKGDILSELYCRDNELSEIILTFILSRDVPARWDAWQAFVNDICRQFGLSLGDSAQNRKVGPDELLRLLSETISWQDFQRNFKWPSVAAVGK